MKKKQYSFLKEKKPPAIFITMTVTLAEIRSTRAEIAGPQLGKSISGFKNYVNVSTEGNVKKVTIMTF